MPSEEWNAVQEELLDFAEGKKILEFHLTEKVQQARNLEEYMLKGVAFRDELQAQLAEYKRLLDEEVVVSLALVAELNDIAAAAGIFRHPDEKDQVANAVAALVERLAEKEGELTRLRNEMQIRTQESIVDNLHG